MTLTSAQRTALFALADGRERTTWRRSTLVSDVATRINQSSAASLAKRKFVRLRWTSAQMYVRITEPGLALVRGTDKRQGESGRDGTGDSP